MKLYQARKAEFDVWHKDNPMIWAYFQRFALEAVDKNRKKISHWLIINRIRWEVYVLTTGEDFKIDNNFIAFYARLWIEKYPQHKDLFNIKHMVGEPWQQELI
jgi:hypothetical protein